MTRSSTTIAAAVLGGALTLGAVGVGTAVLPGVAGAQTDTAAAPSAESAPTGEAAARLARHPRLRQLAREEARVAADTIGIGVDDLRAAVRDGLSIAEVAEANGVDPRAVVDAVVADLGGRLDRAVADGKLTQERADRIAERLPTRVENLVNRHRVAGAEG